MPDTHRILGRLVKDAEVKETKNGKRYVQFIIASEHGYDEYKTVSFFSCKAWEATSSRAFNFLSKWGKRGYLVDIVGDQLQAEAYTKRDGTVGAAMNLNVIAVYSVPKRKTDDQQGPKGGSYKGVYKTPVKEYPPAAPEHEVAPEDIADAYAADAPPKTGGRRVDDDGDFVSYEEPPF